MSPFVGNLMQTLAELTRYYVGTVGMRPIAIDLVSVGIRFDVFRQWAKLFIILNYN
jgi:hypothetical protein